MESVWVWIELIQIVLKLMIDIEGHPTNTHIKNYSQFFYFIFPIHSICSYKSIVDTIRSRFNRNETLITIDL